MGLIFWVKEEFFFYVRLSVCAFECMYVSVCAVARTYIYTYIYACSGTDVIVNGNTRKQ